MSEHIFRFLLSELTTARIRCKACGVVTELPVTDMGNVTACPSCRAKMEEPQHHNSIFLGLANAVRDVLNKSATAEIEFVLPEK